MGAPPLDIAQFWKGRHACAGGPNCNWLVAGEQIPKPNYLEVILPCLTTYAILSVKC